MGHVYELWWWGKEVSSDLSPVWDCFCGWCASYAWSNRSGYPEGQPYQVFSDPFDLPYSKTSSPTNDILMQIFCIISLISLAVFSTMQIFGLVHLFLIHMCYVCYWFMKGDHIWKDVALNFRFFQRRHCLQSAGPGPSHWHLILSGTVWVSAGFKKSSNP